MPKRRGRGPRGHRGPPRRLPLPPRFGGGTTPASVGAPIALTEITFATSAAFAAPTVAERVLTEATFSTAGAFAAQAVALRPIAPAFATSGAFAAVLVATRVLAEIRASTVGTFDAPALALRPVADASASSGTFNAGAVALRPLNECQFTTAGTFGAALVALRALAPAFQTTGAFTAPIGGASVPTPAIDCTTSSTFDVVLVPPVVATGTSGGGPGTARTRPVSIDAVLDELRARSVVRAERPFVRDGTHDEAPPADADEASPNSRAESIVDPAIAGHSDSSTAAEAPAPAPLSGDESTPRAAAPRVTPALHPAAETPPPPIEPRPLGSQAQTTAVSPGGERSAAASAAGRPEPRNPASPTSDASRTPAPRGAPTPTLPPHEIQRLTATEPHAEAATRAVDALLAEIADQSQPLAPGAIDDDDDALVAVAIAAGWYAGNAW